VKLGKNGWTQIGPADPTRADELNLVRLLGGLALLIARDRHLGRGPAPIPRRNLSKASEAKE